MVLETTILALVLRPFVKKTSSELLVLIIVDL